MAGLDSEHCLASGWLSGTLPQPGAQAFPLALPDQGLTCDGMNINAASNQEQQT